MTRALRGVWLGRRRYEPVHAFQEALLAARQGGSIGDTVLFVEHEPVVTFGRGAHAENVLVPPESLSELGVDVVRTGRGGDVTLHLPGQLVCYPVLDLSPDRRERSHVRPRRSHRSTHYRRSGFRRFALEEESAGRGGESFPEVVLHRYAYKPPD